MKFKLSTFVFVSALFFSKLLFAEAPSTSSSLLKPFVDKHELAGAVALVADKNKVLSVEAVGFADIAAGKVMRQDNIFWIASQTKPMTAVAVMMLVDDGKISLDDPIEKYLPEFRGQMVVAEKDNERIVLRKPKHPITVRETLNHTSGLPFKSAIEEPTLDGLSLSSAVRSYAMTPLLSEPGTVYRYSNAGINTAARLIEVVGKVKYEDFMQQKLFDPLGMKDTTFWPNEAQSLRVAKSYRPDASKTNLAEFPISQLIHPLSDRVHRFPMPAGGLFSTAIDTSLFCRMLLNNGELDGKRYLSENAMRELSKRQTPPAMKESYGLGFSVSPDSYGHGGAQATNMEIRSGKGLVLVWMVQHGGFPGEGSKAQGAFKSWALDKFGK